MSAEEREGGTGGGDLSGPPHIRTAAEIKAAYGFKPKTNVSGLIWGRERMRMSKIQRRRRGRKKKRRKECVGKGFWSGLEILKGIWGVVGCRTQ